MHMDLTELLSRAESAAKKAGEEILQVYQSESFEEETKVNNSPLTLADKNAHNTIVKHLQETNIPILSEEGKEIPYAERKDWDRFWMVDPLDGTKEFIKRNGEFTVNIALIENQKAILGVIYVPVTDQLYSGLQGTGATLEKNGQKKDLQKKSTPSDLEEIKNLKGLSVVASKSHLDKNTEDFIAQLEDSNTVSMGSSLKFMALANGEAQVYPRFAPTMEWDTAAAQGILESLDYKVYQYPELTPLEYNREILLNPSFIAF